MSRPALTTAIFVFSLGIIAQFSFYGPMRRSYVTPPQAHSVATSSEILRIWEREWIRGRVAVTFSRYLNALETKDAKDVKVMEQAMNHGLVRTAYHIVPDRAWPEVHDNFSRWPVVKQTDTGLVGLFEDGRVYVMPLSRFTAVTEQALAVIEPSVWTESEKRDIVAKLRSGAVRTDLLTVIRGTPADAGLFSPAVARPFP